MAVMFQFKLKISKKLILDNKMLSRANKIKNKSVLILNSFRV